MRRSRIGGGAVVAVVVLLLAITACAPGPTPATPVATATGWAWPAATAASVPPVDVVVGEQLWLANGEKIPLSWAGPYPAVTRVSAGWLVFGGAETSTVYLLTSDGRHTELLRDGGFVALSWDRLAYRSGEEIVLARIEAGKLVTVARTGGVGDLGPNMLLGDAVLLSTTETGGGPDRYDLWYPDRGAYQPSSLPAVLVAGPMADGRSVVGFAGEDNCLARLELPTLRTTATACEVPLVPSWLMPMSPDRRWLLGMPYDGKDNVAGIALVDLSTVFDQPKLAAMWPIAGNRTVLVDTCVWPEATSAVCGSEGALVRLQVGASPVADWLALPSVPKEPDTDVSLTVIPVRVASASGGLSG